MERIQCAYIISYFRFVQVKKFELSDLQVNVEIRGATKYIHHGQIS